MSDNRWMLEPKEYGEPGSTHIQWKGTAVCMDVYCTCGELIHFDTWFAYVIGCSECGAIFRVGHSVAITAATREEIAEEWYDDLMIKWSDGTNWYV